MSEGNNLKAGDMVQAEVTSIAKFGAFVKLSDNRKGLIHISQVADTFVDDINKFLKVGDKVQAKVKAIAPDGKIDLTLKKETAAPPAFNRDRSFKNPSFEDKLKAFLKKSDERRMELRRNIEAKGGDL